MLTLSLLALTSCSLAVLSMKDEGHEPAVIHPYAPRTRLPESRSPGEVLRVLTYNIRHGFGTDEKLDLGRSASAIDSLRPDIVALQEVDESVQRSQRLDQPKFLAQRLSMDAAFGAFMPYDGGRYGLAILSKLAIVRAHAIRLPEGHEPRVALVAEVRLPSGRTIHVVNLHLDWVHNDSFRFAQASKVVSELKGITGPCLVLGDFNDQPGSRAIKLFNEAAVEAKKPLENRFTFSSDKPQTEIDFIFALPSRRWKVGQAVVVDLPVVSDHRPVWAQLELKP